MCFDLDSRPPITPIAGGALASRRLVLTAHDGNRLAAFEARPGGSADAAILILPDVRGLHPYYEELALRFAENGIDALAIDYFGRTAGAVDRDETFEYMPHVGRMTWPGTRADIQAGVEHLRSLPGMSERLFGLGFCMGGRLSFLAATLDLGLDGVIGFYGRPTGAHPNGSPAPADLAIAMRSRVLALFAGADPGISSDDVSVFEASLEHAGVDHHVVTYADAPHSFFDRKADAFAAASAAAWEETLRFIRDRTVQPS